MNAKETYYFVVSCPTDEFQKGQSFMARTMQDFLRVGHWPVGMKFEDMNGDLYTVQGGRGKGETLLRM